MLSFARLASFVLFVLSLSFLTCASSTPKSAELTARDYGYSNGANAPGQAVLDIIVDLKAKIDVNAAIYTTVSTIAEVNAAVALLVDDVTVAVNAVVALGANIDVDVDIKAKIAAEIVAILTLIVKVCADVTAKFGLAAVLVILASIDACIHLLLVSLDVCIEGIVAICVKLLVSVDIKVFIEAKLNLCATLLALVSA